MEKYDEFRKIFSDIFESDGSFYLLKKNGEFLYSHVNEKADPRQFINVFTSYEKIKEFVGEDEKQRETVEFDCMEFLILAKKELLWGNAFFVLDEKTLDFYSDFSFPLIIFNEDYGGEYSEAYVNSLLLLAQIRNNSRFKLSFISDGGNIRISDNKDGIKLNYRMLFFLRGDTVSFSNQIYRFKVKREDLLKTAESIGVSQKSVSFSPPSDFFDERINSEDFKVKDLKLYARGIEIRGTEKEPVLELPAVKTKEKDIEKDIVCKTAETIREDSKYSLKEKISSGLKTKREGREKSNTKEKDLASRLIKWFVIAIVLIVSFKIGSTIIENTDIESKKVSPVEFQDISLSIIDNSLTITTPFDVLSSVDSFYVVFEFYNKSGTRVESMYEGEIITSFKGVFNGPYLSGLSYGNIGFSDVFSGYGNSVKSFKIIELGYSIGGEETVINHPDVLKGIY